MYQDLSVHENISTLCRSGPMRAQQCRSWTNENAGYNLAWSDWDRDPGPGLAGKVMRSGARPVRVVR